MSQEIKVIVTQEEIERERLTTSMKIIVLVKALIVLPMALLLFFFNGVKELFLLPSNIIDTITISELVKQIAIRKAQQE